MQVRLTHLLFGEAERPVEALGREEGESGRRLFLPGWLACGECARCRRGLVAACPRGRPLFEAAGRPAVLELEGRFLTPIDEPAGATSLGDDAAACAGVVAEVSDAQARAGLGPEQVAVWLGDDPRARIGARLTARRGCPCFRLGAPGEEAEAGVTVLDVAAAPATWAAAVAAVASAGPGELRARRLFVTTAAQEAIIAALSLVEPGATLVFLGAPAAPPIRLADLPLCRVLVGQRGGAYHPDLVPEALAALRADPALLAGLIVPADGPVPGRLAVVRLGP
jgi:threonine dehydrogenase-like Zn-dependent dehydrogenase